MIAVARQSADQIQFLAVCQKDFLHDLPREYYSKNYNDCQRANRSTCLLLKVSRAGPGPRVGRAFPESVFPAQPRFSRKSWFFRRL